MQYNTNHNMLIVLIAMVFLISCDKDDDKSLPPTINFKTGTIYTNDSDTVKIGGALYFGVQARANGVSITNFTVTKVFPDNTSQVVFDTGLYNTDLNIDKRFYQNIEDEVEWTFRVMDKNRLSSEISLTVFKDPNSEFGGIKSYTSVTMGYQDNGEYGQFFDLNNGKVYSEDSAQFFISDIDVLTYYIEDEDLPSPVFSSPGEYDHYSNEAADFYHSITGWESRNFTLWDISVDDNPVSAEAFDNCHNDSLLIVEYDEVWGKMKFKWATAGRVIPFLTKDGRKGMIKVIRADHNKSGSIEFDMKIQHQ